MGQKDRQQSMGLDILRPDDRTLWKRALKPKRRRRTDERKLVFASHSRSAIVTLILNYLKDRVNEKHHRG